MKFLILDNSDKKMLFNYLKNLENNYFVEIKKRRNIRSNNQNRYYWKCIVQELGNSLGYFPSEMHDILRSKFLQEWEMLEVNNKKVGIKKVKSTTDLDTKAFEIYAEQIRIWALTEFNIRLMLPNEFN
jgi:hypothetical protein|tara:strand:- start:520 stop:903 length:384 start_codon:yes stop_codon:yes gene_type:complete